METINCDSCNYSKYAGYLRIDNSEEYCLLFDKNLRKSKDCITNHCKECSGKSFNKMNWISLINNILIKLFYIVTLL